MWPRSELVGRVRPQRYLTQLPTNPLPVRATLTPVGGAAVAQLAGTEVMTVPQPRPVAVAASPPKGVAIVRVREIAHSVGVVVDFRVSDVTAGDTNMKRDVNVGTRTLAPEGSGAPAAAPR